MSLQGQGFFQGEGHFEGQGQFQGHICGQGRFQCQSHFQGHDYFQGQGRFNLIKFYCSLLVELYSLNVRRGRWAPTGGRSSFIIISALQMLF